VLPGRDLPGRPGQDHVEHLRRTARPPRPGDAAGYAHGGYGAAVVTEVPGPTRAASPFKRLQQCVEDELEAGRIRAAPMPVHSGLKSARPSTADYQPPGTRATHRPYTERVEPLCHVPRSALRPARGERGGRLPGHGDSRALRHGCGPRGRLAARLTEGRVRGQPWCRRCAAL